MQFLDLSNKKILVIGAHPDDIELGMGGTLHQIKKYNPKIVIFSNAANIPGNENIEKDLENSLGSLGFEYTCLSYKTMDFVNQIAQIRNDVYKLRDADIVFSTSKNSQHLDHRILGDAVDDIMLDKTILFYEDIRSGQNQLVNCWNEIKPLDLDVKCKMIEQYSSQKKRSYFQNNVIVDRARFRGSQIEKQYAETFEVKRLIL